MMGGHRDGTLYDAVDLWCSDRAAALERYGPIGEWDVSQVVNMKYLFIFKTGFNDSHKLGQSQQPLVRQPSGLTPVGGTVALTGAAG
jgi:hypothetical protein